MRNLVLIVAAFLLSVSTLFGQNNIIKPVIDIPYYETKHGGPGWEERGPEFRRWLAPSVMVTAWPNGGGGSGTICYYDSINNWAYVISCGHLYSPGYRSAEYYKSNKHYKKITVSYHNDKKLDKLRTYKAETLCYVWRNHLHDVSLLRFKPDWVPWINRIAPKDYKLEKGKMYHSCGCDGLRPVAHYLVEYMYETRGEITEVVTRQNSPRGGRSGGGVFTDDHQLLFICSRGGGGNGYWTSLKQIHEFLEQEGFKFVLEGRNLANQIPIVDHNNSQGKYKYDYIPSPLLLYKED